ncbi:MAG: choice-of-anchor A family protein, partial [Candidatus Aminicenantes bacterium]|nr:choice-of-anchor A family protein [Candidatus Aminicenantes bacterium]
MVTPAVRVRPEQGFLRSAVAQILIALLVLPPQLFAARGSVVSEPDAGRPERTLSDPRWALPTSPVLPATDPDLPDPAVINSPATVAVATAARPAVLAGRESAPPSTAGLTVASLLPVSLDLGAARRFNGFFFESFTASSSDIEGRLAAGGSVSINHYSIASKLSASASGASLVVGGDLTFPDGRVHGGDIVVGGSAAGLGPAVRNGLGPNQHVYEHAPLPFDFEQERERIERTSQALATLTPNGSVEWKWGGLYLHGDCESPSQVFALSGPQVLDAHTFQVDCVPDGATVVFNINGASAGLTNMSLESLASHQSTTLFHFPEATTLTLRGVGVRGSILAPHAHVDQPQGQVDGSVIARSWNGPMELHNVPFRGVGSGDFCPLYPIVLPYELLSDAEPGQQFLQVPRGHSLGQFSWLSWAGHPNAVTLAQSLLPPGDSYTYVNPDDDTDWLLNVGEWVQGAPGSMNAAAVRRNLDALIGEEIFVPAWSATRGQGSQFDYQTAAFVAVKLLDYRLTGNGWLSFEYLGPAYCYNAPPTVDAGPDRTIELPPGTTTLQGSAEDDGLPNGSLTTSWERLSGPGSVSFVDAQALTTMATFSAVGEYVLRLTADDGELQASDEVWITVEAAQVNEPPLVDAGADQEIVLPIDTVTLEGTVTDDGLPAGGSTTVSWSMTSGPAAVEFATPDSVVTAARFVATGTYVLHLAASDGELTGEDSVTVTVRPPPVPVLVVGDATVTEGHSGTIPAQIALTLSFAPDSEVRVDFQAQDETALSGSDYRPAFGSVVFPAGATSQTITVDVVGDLAIEADETFSVRLGNVVGATLARERAIVTIVNDDSQNLPPLPIEPRAPADGARGVSSDALLTWQSSDPEGMPLAYDVFFGKTFGVTGQSWAAHDVASSNPGARWGAVTAYDERNDRMMVYGGETSAGFADT